MVNSSFKSYIFIISLLAVSCGGSKSVSETNTPIANMSSKDIIKIHHAAIPNFSTLEARMQVVYENEKKLKNGLGDLD